MISPSTLDLPGLTFPASGSQSTEVRLLSLWQPWASLVATMAKCIETRSWQTSYRGRIAIHASANTPKAERAVCWQDPFHRHLLAAARATVGKDVSVLTARLYDMLPKGCIVATCDLVACVKIPPQVHRFGLASLNVPPGTNWHPHNWLTLPPEGDERYFGNYTPGRYAWLLDNIQPLAEPLPWKGSQGLRGIQWPENNPVDGR